MLDRERELSVTPFKERGFLKKTDHHAKHAPVLHRDHPRGAPGRLFPFPEAGRAAEDFCRARIGPGVHVRGASD